jgi:hypothetical protein
LYEDDGTTRAHEQGAWMRREFRQTRSSNDITVAVAAPEGSYRPSPRPLVIEVRVDHEPQSVSLNGSPLSRQTSTAEDVPSWTFDASGFVTVRQRDPFAAVQIVIR